MEKINKYKHTHSDTNIHMYTYTNSYTKMNAEKHTKKKALYPLRLRAKQRLPRSLFSLAPFPFLPLSVSLCLSLFFSLCSPIPLDIFPLRESNLIECVCVSVCFSASLPDADPIFLRVCACFVCERECLCRCTRVVPFSFASLLHFP